MSQQCTPLLSQGLGASWSQGSVWPVFVDLVHTLLDCNFLASGVCPLVGKTGLEACAGFLTGEAGTCPLVGGAGYSSSGGQGHSRGVSRGCCGLRKSLDSLSADEWGCALAQFFVWPEVSQHWSLQAFRWGQVFVPKCQPPGEFTQMNIP